MVCRARVERGGTPRAAPRRQEACCGATYRRHQYLSMVTVQMRCGAFKIRRRVYRVASTYPADARQPCGLRCRNGPLRRADNLVPAALWLADYWACLCVASGQKPSALLEKSHEKIMRRVATIASPSESRAANRDLGLCFVLFVNVHLYNL